jgi:hypothetical protein
VPYLCVRNSLKLDVTETSPVPFHYVQVVNVAASLPLKDIWSHKRNQLTDIVVRLEGDEKGIPLFLLRFVT